MPSEQKFASKGGGVDHKVCGFDSPDPRRQLEQRSPCGRVLAEFEQFAVEHELQHWAAWCALIFTPLERGKSKNYE